MPFVALYHTHKLVVILFILIYLIKGILLLLGNRSTLDKFNKKAKIPEMVVSALLFITGIIMLNSISDFNLLFTLKLVMVLGAIPIAVIAYKRYNKILGVLALVMLISAYGLAEVYKAHFGKRNEITDVLTDPANEGYNIILHGSALYKGQCVVCHGSDGKANLSGAKDLTVTAMTEEEIIAIIKTGKNSMPKMRAIYSDQELKALAAYIKSMSSTN